MKPNEAWIGKDELEFKNERVACRTDVELHPGGNEEVTTESGITSLPDPAPVTTAGGMILGFQLFLVFFSMVLIS